MDLAQLTIRALELRKRFAEFERRTGGREWTRAELMQGFVGDVGDLMKLVMAKEGARSMPDVDRKLAHELADCLWSILVLAHGYGIELESEFTRMCAEAAHKLDAADAPSASPGNKKQSAAD